MSKDHVLHESNGFALIDFNVISDKLVDGKTRVGFAVCCDGVMHVFEFPPPPCDLGPEHVDAPMCGGGVHPIRAIDRGDFNTGCHACLGRFRTWAGPKPGDA